MGKRSIKNVNIFVLLSQKELKHYSVLPAQLLSVTAFTILSLPHIDS